MSGRELPSDHPDFLSVAPIVAALDGAAGGRSGFERGLTQILRTAIDEVIDTPRSGRFLLDQTEKTEKTYLGTKVEILVRGFLGFKKGVTLDMDVNGTDVDIKNTMGSNWSIPTENVNRPALLIRSNENKFICSVGVAVLRNEYLNPGLNKDAKRGVSAQGAKNIWWLMKDHPYPPNFWALLTSNQREDLVALRGGTARISRLFEMIQGRPVSRNQVQGLAQQHDYMKRLRRNGGARDALAAKGIAILSGQYDQEPIKRLGLGPVSSEEFISYTPTNQEEAAYLRAIGCID